MIFSSKFENKPVAGKIIAASMICLSVSACGFDRRINPVLPTHVGSEVDALATDANRRLVLSQKRITDGKENRFVCAEPSPDTVEALAASLKASAKSNRASGNVTEAGFERTLATSAGLLLRRSQGLQFYRDAIFALCQGAMNGITDKERIAELFAEISVRSADLIKAEINSPGWAKPPTVTVINAPVAAPVTPTK
jgi:hypothetical protein